MAWDVAVAEGNVVVAISDPLGPDDWQALFDDIVDEGEGRGATVVVLPAEVPTVMGMAEELRESLETNLRARGFDVIIVP
jgi:hypothetical protein